ncbi:response regulator [Rathayibacter tanaceti]|uniref:Response regulator FixJ n=1 Tax=Rathayibacter tanaceti TaxID=1671680 RepID=A0A166HCT1_9MICO|nr:response regulator [Rathayibacter tanaceti]KZX20366.1 response regulator FixJ [Rathayibacter tanaceti]
MTPGRALVVDDDIVSRLVLSRLLRRSEWVVEEVEDVPEALAALAGGVFDLIVSDYRLSSGTGIDILASLDGLADPPPFVLVTGILERVACRRASRRRLLRVSRSRSARRRSGARSSASSASAGSDGGELSTPAFWRACRSPPRPSAPTAHRFDFCVNAPARRALPRGRDSLMRTDVIAADREFRRSLGEEERLERVAAGGDGPVLLQLSGR